MRMAYGNLGTADSIHSHARARAGRDRPPPAQPQNLSLDWTLALHLAECGVFISLGLMQRTKGGEHQRQHSLGVFGLAIPRSRPPATAQARTLIRRSKADYCDGRMVGGYKVQYASGGHGCTHGSHTSEGDNYLR